jgi:mono/diheme cytochrome c family protein
VAYAVGVKSLVLVLALVACNNNPTTETGAPDGAALFKAQCTACHGPTGKPDEVMVAKLGVKDLTSPELRAKATPAFVEAQITNGSKNKLMPAFAAALSPEQIKAIAAYVASPRFLAH